MEENQEFMEILKKSVKNKPDEIKEHEDIITKLKEKLEVNKIFTKRLKQIIKKIKIVIVTNWKLNYPL